MDEEIKKQKGKLEEGSRLLEEECNEQKVLKDDTKKREDEMKDELRNRVKEIEKREKKLQEDVRVFEEKLPQEQQLRVEFDSRLKKVEKQEKELEAGKISLEKERVRQQTMDEEIKKQKAKLEEGNRLLEEERNEQKVLKDDIKKREDELKDRETAISSTTAKDAVTVTESNTATIEEENTNTKDQDHQQDIRTIENVLELETIVKEIPTSISDEPFDSKKRNKMIENELKSLIMQADQKELEEPFDEDSIEALKKGALKICYRKKYYDVMKDEFIYFPSVAQTIIDYRLMERAETFYFEEEDEYPQELSIGLRSVALELLLLEGDDLDEDYITALAQDIEF